MQRLLILMAISACCCSCSLIFSGYTTSKTLSKTTLLIDSCGKEVILVPMRHVGKQKRYDEIHAYLDALKADGYVTFFELPVGAYFHVDTISDISYSNLLAIKDTISTPTRADTLLLDTLYRKMRRVVGIIPNVEYKYRYKNLAIQSNENLGQTTDRDIWVDYSIYDLIERYEQEYGPVPLSDYDFEIALNDTLYNRKRSTGSTHSWAFLLHYRNDLLERRILESKHQKIAVVYGAAHTRDIKLTLRFLRGFALDKKYNAKKAYPAK